MDFEDCQPPMPTIDKIKKTAYIRRSTISVVREENLLDIKQFAGTPGARRTFLVALALGLGNAPDHAADLANDLLVAVGTLTPSLRQRTLLSLTLPEVTETQAVAADWARQFQRKATLPWGTVSYEHAATIGRFLFLIAYAENLDPCPGDETMSWYEALTYHIGTVWGGDSDAFLAHVTEACRAADSGGA